MKYRIVSDSSSNLLETEEFPYASVAMHVTIGGRDWEDRPGTDVDGMTEAMYADSAESVTACPSPGQWLEAFGDAEQVFCVTITHQLSGSYDSAVTAGSIYEEEHPGRRVYVLDSLGTGPRMLLLIRHLKELLESGTDGEQAYRDTLRYRNGTDLLFVLESVQNFVRNGRINPLLARAIGVLNMRIIGTASGEGKLKVLSKARGTAKSLKEILNRMEAQNYCGGRILIAHHQNAEAAEQLRSLLRERFGDVPVEIHRTSALCSYYAERGGLLIGFEKPAPEQPEAEGVRERVRSLVEKGRNAGPVPRGTVSARS